MRNLFFVLLMFSATSYASEVAKWSVDDTGQHILEFPYLELVYPHEAYAAVLTSKDGLNFSVDYSTVKQLPLNPNVDKTKLVQLSIGEDGWFLETPYIEKDLHFPKEIYSSSFYSTTGEIFITEGFIRIYDTPPSCSTSKPINCPTLNYLQPPSEDLIPWLGAGMDSDRNWLKQEKCLSGVIQEIGTSEAKLDSSLISNFKDVLKVEKSSANGKLSIKFFKAHANTKYEKIFKQTSHTQSYVLNYKVNLGSERIDAVSLSERGKLVTQDACDFRRYCGDKYVSEITKGGKVYVEMTFKFKTTEQKKEFAAGGGFELKPKLFSIDLTASVSRLSQTTKKEGSLEIVASQEGGKVEDLVGILGTEGNSCSLDNLIPCQQAVDNIVAYVQNGFAETLRDYPSVSKYKYSGFDYVMDVPNLTSDATSEIKQAREDLATEYERRLVDLDKIRNLLQISLSSERKQRMEYLQPALETDIENLSKTGIDCFSDLGNCLANKCETFDNLVSYDPKELVLPPYEGLIAYYPFTPESQSDVVINSTSPFIGAEIYQHSKFRGIVKPIKEYYSSLPDMENSASSAKVHMGCTLILYKYPNYGGSALPLGHGHYPEFGSFNDKASSAKLDCPTVTRANSNGTILDMSGNDNHGIVYGTNELADGEYSFPYGSFIDVPGNINPSFLTLSAWINPVDATRSVILGKISNAGGGSEQYVLSLYTGKAAITVKKDGGWYPVIASNNVVLNEWSLITGTWDGSSLNIYVNGVLKGRNQNIPAGGLDQLGSGSTRIGMWWHQDPQFFTGKMDNILISERALSDVEVLTLYNCGKDKDIQLCGETPPQPETDETNENDPIDDDYETQLVTTAYCSILDREADEAGLNNFVNLMTNDGLTAKQVAQELLNSEEFKQRFFDTKSTTEYVTYIYNLLLQREPDSDGLTAWVNNVEQQGWSIIIEGFLNSEEYMQSFGDDSIPMKDGC